MRASGAWGCCRNAHETGSFELEEATIADIHHAMREGRLTCRALAPMYLQRIRAYSVNGPQLNAFININLNILDEDEFQATGHLRPLHGIPVNLKDSIDTAGIPTTAGSALLANSIPKRDSFIVGKLKAAGALVLGKNTLGDLSGSSYSTVNGIPRNPYKLNRVPGGSSSGSGVAVAANLTAVAVGENTLASVRTHVRFPSGPHEIGERLCRLHVFSEERRFASNPDRNRA